MIGRGRKGLSTKIHLALSGAGVQSACLSEGQRVDMKIFPMLWELGDWTGIEYVIADKGYDYAAVRIPIRKAEKTPVIPRCSNAIFPGLQDIYKSYYRTRSAIERFFGRIKENKRLALRSDKLAHTFFSFFALAAIKSLGLIC
jgi:transposase